MLSTLARIFSASLYYWASSFLALALYAAWTRKQLKNSLRVARIMLDHTRKGRPHRQQFHNSGHAWLARNVVRSASRLCPLHIELRDQRAVVNALIFSGVQLSPNLKVPQALASLEIKARREFSLALGLKLKALRLCLCPTSKIQAEPKLDSLAHRRCRFSVRDSPPQATPVLQSLYCTRSYSCSRGASPAALRAEFQRPSAGRPAEGFPLTCVSQPGGASKQNCSQQIAQKKHIRLRMFKEPQLCCPKPAQADASSLAPDRTVTATHSALFSACGTAPRTSARHGNKVSCSAQCRCCFSSLGRWPIQVLIET